MVERVDPLDPQRGLIVSVVGGYRNLPASTRVRLGTRPRASEAYFWLVTAGLLVFASDLVAKAAQARAAGDLPGAQNLAEWTTSAVLGAIAFVPVATALTAVPAWLVLRFCFGGKATCSETAVAAAWAALLSAPPCALASLAEAGIVLSPLPGGHAVLVVGATGATALGISVWIWSQCVASAHGFRSGRRLFAGTIALGGAGWWIVGSVIGT